MYVCMYVYIYIYKYIYIYIYIQLPSAIPPPCLGIRKRSRKSHMTNIGPNIKQSRPTNTKIRLNIDQHLLKHRSSKLNKSIKLGRKMDQDWSTNPPKLLPKSSKIGPKIYQNRSQGPLGEIWGPSWSQDGPRPPQEVQHPFRWTPLDVEAGGQNSPKIGLEAMSNGIIFWMIF